MAQSVVRSGQHIQLKSGTEGTQARWHGSVGRAHRSHRWGRWFESNCHHHPEPLIFNGSIHFALTLRSAVPGFYSSVWLICSTKQANPSAGSVAGKSGWLLWQNRGSSLGGIGVALLSKKLRFMRSLSLCFRCLPFRFFLFNQHPNSTDQKNYCDRIISIMGNSPNPVTIRHYSSVSEVPIDEVKEDSH